MKKFIGRIRDYFHEAKGDNLFRLDGAVPLNKAIPFGFQHVLAMFVANIAPLFIVLAAQYQGVGLSKEVTENAIRSAIFVAAIGTTFSCSRFGESAQNCRLSSASPSPLSESCT
jgi:xanthine/uracil permease